MKELNEAITNLVKSGASIKTLAVAVAENSKNPAVKAAMYKVVNLVDDARSDYGTVIRHNRALLAEPKTGSGKNKARVRADNGHNMQTRATVYPRVKG